MAYLYLIKVRIMISLAYRFEAISSVLIQIIILIVNSFFWRAVYGSNNAVNGISLEQMLVYSTVSLLLGFFFSTGVEAKLKDKIREGSVAVDYIKPINMFGMYLADDIGQIAVNITQKAIPMILVAAIFIRPPLPVSSLAFLLFLISTIFGFIILWLIAAIFGLLNFWLVDIGPIGGAKNLIIGFLSGSFIPIWFFPEWIQKILAFLPFLYIYQTPLSIYVGKTAAPEALFSIGIQLLWALLFFMLFSFTHRRVRGNIVVQGG